MITLPEHLGSSRILVGFVVFLFCCFVIFVLLDKKTMNKKNINKNKTKESKKKGKIILKKEKQTKQNHKKRKTNKNKQTNKQTKTKTKKKERKKKRKENICFSNVAFGQYTLRDTRKHFHKHFKFHTNSIYLRNIWC